MKNKILITVLKSIFIRESIVVIKTHDFNLTNPQTITISRNHRIIKLKSNTQGSKLVKS